MKKTKFFLSHPQLGEKQVTKEEYIKAERAAGFRPKMSSDDPRYMTTIATAGFGSGSGIIGYVKYGDDYEDL